MADKKGLLSDKTGYSTFKTENTEDIFPAADKDGSYTVAEAIEKIGVGRFQVKIGVAAAFAWMADGMEIMVLSLLAPVLLCEWNLKTWQEALLTTVVFMGFTIGSPVAGFIADKIGRRKSLFITTLLVFIFGAASALAPSYTGLLILRFLTGFGTGGCAQAVTYFSEFLPNKMRGKSVILLQIFFALGGIIEVALAILILIPYGWRLWLIVSAFPALGFVVACFFLPDSPRYSLACGNVEKALATLQQAAKDNRAELPPGELVKEPEVQRGNFMDMLQPKYRLTTGLLSLLWFCAVFSYYGIVLFTTDMIKVGSTCNPYVYGNMDEICHNETVPAGTHLNASVTSTFSNMSSTNTSDMGTCTGCKPLTLRDYYDLLLTSSSEPPGVLLTAVLVDVIGRKKTLSLEFCSFSAVCFLLFICMSRVPMVITLFIGRAMATSALQVLFLYTPEVYLTAVRALSLGSGCGFGRLGATVTPYIAEVLLKSSLYIALGVYGVFGIVSGIVALLLPFESKGSSLQ